MGKAEIVKRWQQVWHVQGGEETRQKQARAASLFNGKVGARIRLFGASRPKSPAGPNRFMPEAM